MFSKRGTVAVRSLKSGYGEFVQDAALTNDEISQLEASFSYSAFYSVALRGRLGGNPVFQNRLVCLKIIDGRLCTVRILNSFCF